MNRRAFWGAILVLLVANAVIFFARPETHPADAHPEPLRTGDQIATITAPEIPSGREVELEPNLWNMLLYLREDSAVNQRRLVAAQELLEELGDDGLAIAAVAPQTFPPLAELIATERVRFPVLHDAEGAIRRQLRLPHPSDTLFLFDDQWRLRFQSVYGAYGVTDMRYLAEKHVEKRIIYPEDASGPRLVVGEGLPPLGLRDLWTGEPPAEPDPGDDEGRVLVFFTSECSTCSLGPSMATFRAFKTRLSAEGRSAVAVFSPLFSPLELASHAAELELDGPLWTTDEEGLRYFDPDNEPASIVSDLTVVEVDEHEVVRSIRPLTTVLKELEH